MSFRNLILKAKGKKPSNESETDSSNSIIYRPTSPKQSVEQIQFSQNPQENYFYIALENSSSHLNIFARLQDAIESLNEKFAMSTNETEPKIQRVTLDREIQIQFAEKEIDHLTLQDKSKIKIIENMNLALAKTVHVLNNFDQELITNLKQELNEEERVRISEITTSNVAQEEKTKQLYQFISSHKNQLDLMNCIKSKYLSLIQAENKEASNWASGYFYIFFADSSRSKENSFPSHAHVFQINGSLENTIKRNINNLIPIGQKIPQVAKVKITINLLKELQKTENTILNENHESQIKIIKYMDIDLAKIIAFVDIKGLISTLEQYVVNDEEDLKNLHQINQMVASKETKATQIYDWLKSKLPYTSSPRGSMAIEKINKVKSYINKESEKATSTFFYIPLDYVNQETRERNLLPEGKKLYIFENLKDALQHIPIDHSKKQKDPKDPRIAKVKISKELELAKKIKESAGKPMHVDPKKVSAVVGYISPNLAKILCCINAQELASFLKNHLSQVDCNYIDKIVTSANLDEKEKLEAIYHWLEQKKYFSVPKSLHKEGENLALEIQEFEKNMLKRKAESKKEISTKELETLTAQQEQEEYQALLEEKKINSAEIMLIADEQQLSIEVANRVYDFVEKKYQETLKKTEEKPQEPARARNHSIFDLRRPSSPPLDSSEKRPITPPLTSPSRPSSPTNYKDDRAKRLSAMFKEALMSPSSLKLGEERPLLKK